MSSTEWRIRRTEAVGSNGMVAAKHPLAVRAGLEVLESGGNAVDAAVTTAFAVGVCEPYMSGVGGGGYMVVRHGDEVAVIDYFPRAPLAARPDMFELLPDFKPDRMGFSGVKDRANQLGYRALAVPGTVAGLALALERFGTISLRQALAPAIRLAADGYPLHWHALLLTAAAHETLAGFPTTAAIFLRDGLMPKLAEDAPAIQRQPDLADTLQRVADRSPEEFYRGETARCLVDGVAAGGGILALEDLAAYRAAIQPPLQVEFRGYRLHGPSGPTGATSIAMSLRLLERFDLAGFGHNSLEALNLVAQAARRTFADRLAYLADPAHVEVPWEGLLSTGYAAERAQSMGPRSHLGEVAPGDPWRHQPGHAPVVPTTPGHNPVAPTTLPRGGDEGHTTHLCVVDRHGSAVSLTQTLGSLYGCGVVAPGTGVLFNNLMTLFHPEPGHANSIAPGKRPVSSMSPFVVTLDGRPYLALGAPGGRRIVDTVLQSLLNVLEFRLGIQDACSGPYLDLSGPELTVDDRIAAETCQALAALGHQVAVRPQSFYPKISASPTGILRDPSTGALYGGADPFGYGVAEGI